MRRYIGIVTVLLVLLGMPAQAQQCNAAFEVVSKIRPPDFGSYNLWESAYGEISKTEEFVTGMVTPDSNTLAAGHSYVYEDGAKNIILAEFDRRGRVVWEMEHKVAGLVKINKLLRAADGFVLLGDIEDPDGREKVWLGFFNFKGELKGRNFVEDKSFDLRGHDLIRGIDGKSLLLAASAKGRGFSDVKQGMVYTLDARGNTRGSRSYLPGIENEILALAVQDGKFYIGAGHVETTDGRGGGWIIKLDAQGKIMWQRQYARGLSARFTDVSDYIEKFILAFGHVVPGDFTNRGAWVSVIDGETGDIGWQRYYTGNLDHYGRKVIAHEDRQISLLIDGVRRGKRPAKMEEGEEEDYAMLLALSPRGVILERDTYYKSEGVLVNDFFLGKNFERIMMGQVRMKYEHKTEKDSYGEPLIQRSKEAWAIAGAPVEPYQDPCVQGYSFLP